MDELELLSLISNGENETVDFKQELDLESARSKAEFIKDVISIANSAPIKGYLIIGVDNNNLVVGVDKLEEEQLQQIAYTYISPAVVINCYCVLIKDSLPAKNVGVIEIRALKRPHKVGRALGHIQQDEVFIRRGSVVMKASPDEIIMMHKSSSDNLMIIQSIYQRAQTHYEIGNYELAISLFSEAINILPNVELLISRAKANEEWANLTGDPSISRTANDAAFIDFTNSLKLKPSPNEEKVARLGRIRLNNSTSGEYTWEEFELDYKWLYEHTDGYERAEVIFTYVNSWDYHCLDTKYPDAFSKLKEGEEMVVLVDEAISLGFDDPEIFYLRSFGNKVISNFGIALRDVDKAISKTRNMERKVIYMCHRAELLVKMDEYQDAYETLVEAKKIDRNNNGNTVRYHLDFQTRDAVENILCLFGLEKKFSGSEFVRAEPINSMLKLLLLWNSRRISGYSINRDKAVVSKIKTDLDNIMDKYPQIISSLLRLLSIEEKDAIKNFTSDYMFTVKMPSVIEQIDFKSMIYIPLDDEDDIDEG